MSRNIIGKVNAEGELVAMTPVSVGGLGAGEHVDLELAEDGAGRHYIPGTSLAGSIRAWLERRLPEGSKLSDLLFGYVEQKGDKGQASTLYVYDSIFENAVKERRHGIAINQSTGTAKPNFFYTRAILARGARLKLKIELDILGNKDYSDGHPAGVLALILKALCDGKIRFGACKTRGLGKFKLEGLKVNFYDFQNSDSALDLWLDGKESEQQGLEQLTQFKLPELKPERVFNIKINWRAKSPVIVKAGRDGIESDMMPLVSGIDETHSAPVIPGSALKGIFRSQASKILNTLFENNNNIDWPVIDDMFGTKGSDDYLSSDGRAGRIFIDDVYYKPDRPFELKEWLAENEDILNSVTERRQHTAIDRFLGSASDQALYSARPVKRDEENISNWEPISINLDVSNAVSEENINKEIALLKLIIRDFKDGYMPVGFGALRGLGDIEVLNIEYGDKLPGNCELQVSWDNFINSGGSSFDFQDLKDEREEEEENGDE